MNIGVSMKPMSAAIIIENEKLLLIHNSKYDKLRIEPPGGKKEENETFEECVIREVKEELDVDIKIVDSFGVHNTDSPEGAFNVQMYISEIVGGVLKLIESEKYSDYSWNSFEDLIKLRDEGKLVPNLVSSIENLRKLMS